MKRDLSIFTLSNKHYIKLLFLLYEFMGASIFVHDSLHTLTFTTSTYREIVNKYSHKNLSVSLKHSLFRREVTETGIIAYICIHVKDSLCVCKYFISKYGVQILYMH